MDSPWPCPNVANANQPIDPIPIAASAVLPLCVMAISFLVVKQS
jgi:hypothetical protein